MFIDKIDNIESPRNISELRNSNNDNKRDVFEDEYVISTRRDMNDDFPYLYNLSS